MSIRVLRDAQGRLQWEMPAAPHEPTRVALVADAERWHGYVFRLSYIGADISALEITRDGQAAPLTAQLLQRIPLGALDREARRCVGRFLEAWERPPAALRSLFPDPLDWVDAVADPNAAGEDDSRLARLCQRYLELAGDLGWRETLADEFHYGPSSVQTIISRARKRRFLTKVPRGQNGGQLTPKALRLLAPPKMQSAWDRATEEQRAAALDREIRRSVLETELADEFHSGAIDHATYIARSLALDAALMGWTPKDLDLSDDQEAAERELPLMQTRVAGS